MMVCMQLMVSIHIMHWTDWCASAKVYQDQHREGTTIREWLSLPRRDGSAFCSRLSGIVSNTSCDLA